MSNEIAKAVRKHGDQWASHLQGPLGQSHLKSQDTATTKSARRDFYTMQHAFKVRVAIRNFFTEQFAAYQIKKD